MTIETVRRFYGEMKGWNMFDTQFLTGALCQFLEQEAIHLRAIFAGNPKYKHLVEVGCGYGRYMGWAVSSHVAYDGIDIVDWMIDMAEIKRQQLHEQFPNVHCSVHLHPAESLSLLLESALPTCQTTAVAFFPFNCFGNVSSVHEVMRSLYRDRLDVVISTFKIDAKSTALRKQYYQKCGYSNLECTLNKRGLLITSEEGFSAFAYSRNALTEMFASNGYQLASYSEVGEIGAMYHFKPVSGRIKLALERQVERRYARFVTALAANLYVLDENDSSQGERGNLLSFTASSTATKDISADGVALICDRRWHAGARARIEFVGDEKNTRLSFTGVLTRCEVLDQGGFLLAFKFFRPAHQGIEKLFTVLNSQLLTG